MPVSPPFLPRGILARGRTAWEASPRGSRIGIDLGRACVHKREMPLPDRIAIEICRR
jgi:hypothetical protein